MRTTSQLNLLRTIGIDPASSTTPQVTPDILHTEDLHTGGLVVGTPEHTLSIHRTGSNSIAVGTLAPSVTECSLALSRTSHHNQQILKQKSVSQHFGVPVITVCYRSVNVSRRSHVNIISFTAKRSQSAVHRRPKINRSIEMVDLVVIAVVVTPAIPVGILRGVGAAEMIDAVRLPTLRVDLRPFHHGIAVKGRVCNLGNRTVNLPGIVVRIKIMVNLSGVSQHARTRHEFFARIKCPTTIVELTGAEIHSRRSKCRIIHIRRISYSSCGAGGCLDQVIAKQIISLLRGNTGSVRLAAIIGTGTGVRKCGIVIHHTNRHISIRISTVRSDVLEQFSLRFTGRVTSCAPTDNCAGYTTRQLRRNLNFNGVRC